VNSVHVNTRGEHLDDVLPCDACFGNQEDFPGQDAINIICVLGNFVAHPEITHVHGPQTLVFHRVIRNANSGRIVAVYLRFGLRVAKFLKGESKNHAFFAI
jgi:hypothetical protein